MSSGSMSLSSRGSRSSEGVDSPHIVVPPESSTLSPLIIRRTARRHSDDDESDSQTVESEGVSGEGDHPGGSRGGSGRERNNNDASADDNYSPRGEGDLFASPQRRTQHDAGAWWSSDIQLGGASPGGVRGGRGVGVEGQELRVFRGVGEGRGGRREEVWDLSDSVAELYEREHVSDT